MLCVIRYDVMYDHDQLNDRGVVPLSGCVSELLLLNVKSIIINYCIIIMAQT